MKIWGKTDLWKTQFWKENLTQLWLTEILEVDGLEMKKFEPSNVGSTTANPLAKAAGESNGDQFSNSNSKSNSSNDSEIAVELIAEEREAAFGVDLLLVNRSLSTSFSLASFAAGVRNSSILEGLSGVFPVCEGLNTTAMELLLDQIPSSGDSLKSLSSIVLHPSVHVLGDLGLQVSLQSKGSNTSSNLGDEDDEEDGTVGVDEALVLLVGTAASKQRDGQDDSSEDDDKDWSVHIVVSEEVEVVLGSYLGVGSKPNEDDSSQCKENVAEDHEVLDDTFTAVLHDDADLTSTT